MELSRWWKWAQWELGHNADLRALALSKKCGCLAALHLTVDQVEKQAQCFPCLPVFQKNQIQIFKKHFLVSEGWQVIFKNSLIHLKGRERGGEISLICYFATPNDCNCQSWPVPSQELLLGFSHYISREMHQKWSSQDSDLPIWNVSIAGGNHLYHSAGSNK